MINRRGSIFYSPFLVLALLVILTYTGFKFLTIETGIQTQMIGTLQIDLLNIYNSAEKYQFFIQQSAKYAQTNAIVEFYNNGGYYKSGCGNVKGYNLWVKGSLNCFLDKNTIINEFGKMYSDKINEYATDFKAADLKNNYGVKLDNGDFVIKGSEILIAKDSIKYYVKPEFKIRSEDELEFINVITDKVKSNINLCMDDTNCWEKLDSSFKVTKSNRVVYFDIETKNKVGFFEKKPLVLMFALDFNEYNPLFI
ncbi:hypothetical protein HYX18_03355 [Candidatus Woesearchaeota archaeon]|nr:hypothetical protein [Candidatus Woesearchaeota archaeon]